MQAAMRFTSNLLQEDHVAGIFDSIIPSTKILQNAAGFPENYPRSSKKALQIKAGPSKLLCKRNNLFIKLTDLTHIRLTKLDVALNCCFIFSTEN